MRFTLFKKMLISLLFISILMVGGMAWLVNSSFQSGLQDYVNQNEKEKLALVSEKMAPLYSDNNTWETLDVEQWKHILHQVFIPSMESSKAGRKFDRSRSDRVLKKVYLLDRKFNPIFADFKPRPKQKLLKVPVKFEKKTIGWIATKKRNSISGVLEESFYHQQQRNFMWIVLWITLISSVLAWVLVRHFLTPLKRLEKAANALQDGDYSAQIEVYGKDELAALSRRFNELSLSLLRQKENREQWLADISHELRTPISVLKSEIEALQDGIRQAEPKYIDSLHYQVQNLSHLVNDLYQLSLSDAGMQFDVSNKIDLLALIEKNCSQYQIRYLEKNIKLATQFSVPSPVYVKGDEKSLIQLFSNLLENSLRYTDAPGQLIITAKLTQQSIQIDIEDSAPGVPSDALPKLFERLYRVDASRSRLSGGAGLGLSICETIVQAHQGEIKAAHSKLGGLSIAITLPLSAV